jgi:hypothetical protein
MKVYEEDPVYKGLFTVNAGMGCNKQWTMLNLIGTTTPFSVVLFRTVGVTTVAPIC